MDKTKTGCSRECWRAAVFPWIVCLLGAIFYCYEYYLRIAPSVMTHDLMRAFGISALSLGHLVGFYYYAYTPMQLFVGILLDRYGPRRLLFLACLSCAFGSFLFTSISLHLSEVGRFLIGFGSAFAFVGSLKLATIWLPPERFGLISGLATMLGMLGAVFGDVSITYLVDSVGWKHTLIASGFFGVFFAFLLLLLLRDKKPGASGEESSAKPVAIIDGLKSLYGMLRNRNIWLNGVVGCLLYLPLSIFAEMWCPRFLESVHQFTKAQAAWGTSLIFLGWAVGGPFAGSISDYLRKRRLPTIIGSIFGFIDAALLIFMPFHSHFIIYTLLFLSGATCAFQVLVFPIARELSSDNHAGTALALTNMFVMIGGVVQPLVGEILDLVWDGTMQNGIPFYSALDFRLALTIVPVGVFLAAIVAYFIPETFNHSPDESVS